LLKGPTAGSEGEVKVKSICDRLTGGHISDNRLFYFEMVVLSAPMDLGRFLFLPRRRLVGVALKLTLKPEVLARLFSDHERYNIKIKHLFISSLDTSRLSVIVFLDVTDSKIQIEDLLDQHEKLGLIEVQKVIKSPVEGFVADTFSLPLTAFGPRAVIFRECLYKELFLGLRRWFSRGSETFLYEVGCAAGLSFGKTHKEQAKGVGLEDPVQIYTHISTAIFQWAGFGRIEVRELTPEGGNILVYDSFECELGKGSVMPYSQFVRGIIAGTLSELFGRTYNVTEESCIAKGDPVCRFVAKAIQKG
jgi:predicted hydrocarbon binding protein